MRRFEFECQNCGWKTENIGEKHFCPKDEKNKEEIKPILYDHDRIVAELKAEIARLKVELGRPYDKVDRLFEANKKHLETIASQKRVIEKLIEQRNVYHTIATEWGATETPFETLEAQIAAIEKGVRSEQR